MSALLTPALTTMDWNVDRIVRAAVRLVLAAIERKPYRRRTVQPPHLRERGSTGPPAVSRLRKAPTTSGVRSSKPEASRFQN
jgi:hypothetical protein